MTAGGREFQVAGAAQLKDRLLMSVRLKMTNMKLSLRRDIAIFRLNFSGFF